MAALEEACAPAVVLLDEFGATLDRRTALVVARRFARSIRRTAHTLVVATSHEDLSKTKSFQHKTTGLLDTFSAEITGQEVLQGSRSLRLRASANRPRSRPNIST